MTGRLIFYEAFDDCDTGINMGTFYEEYPMAGTQYKNVIYLTDFTLERAGFVINEVEEVDNTGTSRLISRNSIETRAINFVINSNLLGYLNSIDAHTYKFLEIFNDPPDNRNTTIYPIDRVELVDNANALNTTGQVRLVFEIGPEIKTGCCDEDFTVLSEFLAFWDIDDDGTEDIDADAPFLVASLNGEFNAWQLYFESDGVTPLVSGDVQLIVNGVEKNGDSTVLGTFTGQFGDLFSDSTKWNSTYSIWDYFNVADSVGHRNNVRFAKKDFAQDFNFVGSATLDNALKLEFFLSVNDSPSEKVTLQEIYSILSSFGNQTSDELLNFVLQQQVNKVNEQPTLTTYAETRTDLTTSIPAALNAFSLRFIDTFRKVYDISAIPVNESYSIINRTVLSGLLATQRKSTNGLDDLSLASRTDIATAQQEGLLSSTATRQVTIYYWVQYQGAAVSFPISGAPSAAGQWFYDGVNQGALNTALGYHSQTLPTLAANEDVHTVKLATSTSGGTGPSLEISEEFQVRLLRFY